MFYTEYFYYWRPWMVFSGMALVCSLVQTVRFFYNNPCKIACGDKFMAGLELVLCCVFGIILTGYWWYQSYFFLGLCITVAFPKYTLVVFTWVAIRRAASGKANKVKSRRRSISKAGESRVQDSWLHVLPVFYAFNGIYLVIMWALWAVEQAYSDEYPILLGIMRMYMVVGMGILISLFTVYGTLIYRDMTKSYPSPAADTMFLYTKVIIICFILMMLCEMTQEVYTNVVPPGTEQWENRTPLRMAVQHVKCAVVTIPVFMILLIFRRAAQGPQKIKHTTGVHEKQRRKHAKGRGAKNGTGKCRAMSMPTKVTLATARARANSKSDSVALKNKQKDYAISDEKEVEVLKRDSVFVQMPEPQTARSSQANENNNNYGNADLDILEEDRENHLFDDDGAETAPIVGVPSLVKNQNQKRPSSLSSLNYKLEKEKIQKELAEKRASGAAKHAARSYDSMIS